MEPIVHSYELMCRADRAFDVYVDRIGEWWHPGYTANADSLRTVRIEPGLNVADRVKFRDWPLILDRFADVANGG